MKTRMFIAAVVIFAASVHAGFPDGLFSSKPAEFKSVEGGFTIQTPVTFKKVSMTKEMVFGPDGKSFNVTAHCFTGSKNGWAYYVYYCDCPAGVLALGAPGAVADGILNSSGLGVAESMNGELLMETKITLGRYPGREVLAGTTQGGKKVTVRARFYLVKERIYQTMVVAPSGAGGVAEIEKFLNSFKLLK